MRSAMITAPPVSPSATRMPNSSPPSRTARSVGRRHSVRRFPTAHSSSSPAAWPSESLTVLKSSRSTNRMAGAHPAVASAVSASLSRSRKRARLPSPVSDVVIRLMAQPLLQLGELRQRAAELPVLEGHRRVVGKRLEELQVLAHERRDVAQAITDDQHADRLGVAAQAATIASCMPG